MKNDTEEVFIGDVLKEMRDDQFKREELDFTPSPEDEGSSEWLIQTYRGHCHHISKETDVSFLMSLTMMLTKYFEPAHPHLTQQLVNKIQERIKELHLASVKS
tara:strand:- start:1943 stop:2251 length:309 start_codon:yes stop_codon:yes gene_type:complete